MTAPAHWESLAERRIRAAMEDGGFDDLPGAGGPLPHAGRPYEPGWWARAHVERLRDERRVAARLRDLDRRLLATATLDEIAMAAEVDAVLAEWADLYADHGAPAPPDRDRVVATWRLLRRGLRPPA